MSFQLSGWLGPFLALLKISSILLKHPTSEDAKKYKIKVSAHFNVCTKKWLNIKVRERSNLALEYTFLGQNRLDCK